MTTTLRNLSLVGLTPLEKRSIFISEHLGYEPEYIIFRPKKVRGCTYWVLDKRKFRCRETAQWAFYNGYLCRTPYTPFQSYFDWDAVLYQAPVSFDKVLMISVDILWKLLAPAIPMDKTIGRSICRSDRWETVGLHPLGHHLYEDRYAWVMRESISRLAVAGKITFQHCGDVWEIQRRNG